VSSLDLAPSKTEHHRTFGLTFDDWKDIERVEQKLSCHQASKNEQEKTLVFLLFSGLIQAGLTLVEQALISS